MKDEIKKMGFEYFGLANDNGLDNFTIYRVRTVSNVIFSFRAFAHG